MNINELNKFFQINHKEILFARFHAFFALVLLWPVSLNAQNDGVIHDLSYTLPRESGEKITVFTDRNLYLAAEKIYFTVNYTVTRELKTLAWSNVLYVELIRWNGDRISQSKFALDKTGASGYLEIPGEVLSGNYYIRAYTRWMRNYPASDYGYSVLKIVNPYKEEIDPGPDDNVDLQRNIPGETLYQKRTRSIVCSTSRAVYKTREKVDLNLVIDKELSDYYDDYFISVVKTGCLDTSYAYAEPDSHAPGTDVIRFLPEIRGVSVSGHVAEKGTGKPLAGVNIYLSIPIAGTYFSVYKTGEQGEFLFTIPEMSGYYDFFIEALTDDSVEAEIRIDNDYCNVPLILPYTRFELNMEEEKLVQKMMINRQLEERFEFDSFEADAPGKDNKPYVFYGNPQKVIYIGEYIELNDLEEFIFELVPEVIVYHRKGKPYIKMEQETGLLYLEPLVLVDNLPVTGIEQFLRTPLNKLDRIELINQGYVTGNKIFSGLISIYSKNNDFAGIEMNKNSMFFNYGLYSDHTYTFPIYDETSNKSRIPDRRNLLYWCPNLSPDGGKVNHISFYTSDEKGEYIIYVGSINSKDTQGIFGTCFFKTE